MNKNPILFFWFTLLQYYADKARQRRDLCKWWHLWIFCELVHDKQGRNHSVTYFATEDSMTESSWQCRRMPFRAVSSLPNWEGSTCSRSHTGTEVKARGKRPRESPLSASHKQSQLSVMRKRKCLGKHIGKHVYHWETAPHLHNP